VVVAYFTAAIVTDFDSKHDDFLWKACLKQNFAWKLFSLFKPWIIQKILPKNLNFRTKSNLTIHFEEQYAPLCENIQTKLSESTSSPYHIFLRANRVGCTHPIHHFVDKERIRKANSVSCVLSTARNNPPPQRLAAQRSARRSRLGANTYTATTSSQCDEEPQFHESWCPTVRFFSSNWSVGKNY
jgi:hypothetical protein